MRSFVETVRAVHLAAGFAVRPEVWPVSCKYAATALSIAGKIGPQSKERISADQFIRLVNLCFTAGRVCLSCHPMPVLACSPAGVWSMGASTDR